MGIQMDLVGGVCDNCGKYVDLVKTKCSGLHKMTACKDGKKTNRYIKVCWNCAQNLNSRVNFAWGE